MHKHTCTNTHALSLFFSVLLCILSFSGSLLLCQGPNNTPHSTQTQAPPLFACLEFSFWLRGPGQGTKHTSQHLMVAQTPSSVHIHTLLLLCTYATLDGCLQNSPVLKVTPGFLWGPAYSGRLSDNTHYREERKEKKPWSCTCLYQILRYETGQQYILRGYYQQTRNSTQIQWTNKCCIYDNIYCLQVFCCIRVTVREADIRKSKSDDEQLCKLLQLLSSKKIKHPK